MLFVSIYSFIEAKNEVSFVIYYSFIYCLNKISCCFTNFIIIIIYKLYRRYTLPVPRYFIYSFFLWNKQLHRKFDIREADIFVFEFRYKRKVRHVRQIINMLQITVDI